MARKAQPLRDRVLYWLAEVAVFYVFWLLCVDTTAASELCVGAGAAVLAATGAEIVRGLDFARFRPRWAWLAQMWRIPGMVAGGVWLLIKVLFLRGVLRRDIKGELKTVPFEPGGSDPDSAARRALAIIFTTLAPNFIVVRIYRKERRMLYHQILASGVPALTRNLGARP